ncbi:MAG: P-loop NTPase [Kiritimatiellae bacterium]|nr:P-loop NTPase [Kiritimatiellia bacterium]
MDPQTASKNPGLAHVQRILAVSSCKGGVGKSTTAVNLALALRRYGLRVGLLDADVYGPSLPTLVRPENTQLFQREEDGLILPLEVLGLQVMSFGWIDPNQQRGAAILRGPMVSQVVSQLAGRVAWGELDYLVIDFPPGTGDIQLTLTQQLPITAALIVTTPQQLSFVDVVKGIQMFDTVKVPTVGVLQNMSYYECHGEKHYIFGEGAREKLVKQFGFRHTFEIPIDPRLSSDGDEGTPMVASRPADPISNIYYEIAEAVHGEINLLTQTGGTPTLLYNVGQNCELEFPDGRIVEIPPFELRFACRCALCVSENTGERLITREDIDPDVYPGQIKAVGNYAAAVEWSDGHTSSIYPFDYLIELFDTASETTP